MSIKISNFKVGKSPLIYIFRCDLAISTWLGRQRNGIISRFHSLGFTVSRDLLVSLEIMEVRWPFPVPE